MPSYDISSPNPWSIRSPLKQAGHVTIDMCSSDGKAIRQILGRAAVSYIPSLYKGKESSLLC
jgi:ribosomal protein RSM22 (predicted rRNA methylase)